MKILAVDDEKDFVGLLKAALQVYRPGYTLVAASNALDALNLALSEKPDLILLDVMLPDRDGLHVCRKLREFTKAPIILVTAKGSESDIVAGLEAGANDYVAKPFSYKVLMARIDAALRYSALGQPELIVRTGDLEIDLAQRRVRLHNQEVALTPREYSIVEILARNAGQPVLCRTLLARIWGTEFANEKQYLKTIICRLHKKLEDDPSSSHYITNVRSVGYRLEKF